MALYVVKNPKWYESPGQMDGVEEVCIDKKKGNIIRIGKQISNHVRAQMVDVIWEYL